MPGLHALLTRRSARPQPGGFRDAVVLSGGGSLGAAQAGALRDFTQTARLIDAGYEAGRAAVQAEAVTAVPRARRTG